MPKVVDHAAGREPISAAVQHLVGRVGLDGLTMTPAAEAAGVSAGRLQHYFAGKDPLLADMFIRYTPRVRRRAAVPAEASVRAKTAIRDVVTAALTERSPVTTERSVGEHRMWPAFMRRASLCPELAAQDGLAVNRQLDLLSPAIHNGKECGEVVEQTDPASATILAPTDGLATQQRNRPCRSLDVSSVPADAVAQVFPRKRRQWN